MVPHASSTPLTGRPHQEATEVCVGRERRHSASAPVADGVHQGRGLQAKGCCPLSFGGGEARTSVVGVSSRRRGQSSSTQPSGRATITGNRRNVEHTGVQVPIRRPHRRFRGDGGCSAGECHRGGRWKYPPLAPRRRVRVRGALRRHQLPQRPLRTWKRWSTIFPPAVHHPHQHLAGIVRKRHDSFLAENRRRAGRVPRRVLAALLAVEPHRIRGKCRPVCVGMT